MPTSWFYGAAPTYVPVIVQRQRRLNWSSIRGALPMPPTIDEDMLLDILNDQSGSMYGSSDVLNTRDEAALIACTHLAGGARKGRSKKTARAMWHLRHTTFDLDSPMELPQTLLDGRGLRVAEAALLKRSPGGASLLGPALRATEAAPGFSGRRLVVVMSDFELFDGDLPRVLDELVNSSADGVLALVFRSPPPVQLSGTRVVVAQIDPLTNTPADVAQHIFNFALGALPGPRASQAEAP